MRCSAIIAVTSSLLLTACSTEAADPVAVITLTLALQTGDAQSGVVGEAVATNPSVRLTNNQGEAVPGTSVTFQVTGGGGSASGTSQTTDASGVATVGSWTLGTSAGPNTLTATAAGSGIVGNPVSFSATGTAGPHSRVTGVAGDGTSGVAGEPVTTRPSVRAEDAHGNPVSGVAVTFAVTGGGGAVTGGAQTTGADGTATVESWTLGPAVGENTLVATVPDPALTGAASAAADALVFSVTFTVTGTAGPPGAVSVTAGDGQSAPVNSLLPIAPQVLVTDARQNPVVGVSVTFAVASGGGTITGATQTTDASGLASVGGWTLGSTPGENTLTATADGSGITGNPVTFMATGTALVLTKTAGDNQGARVSTAVPVAPEVRLTDAASNPVSGIEVTFAVASGGGTATGLTKTTDADGRASADGWTLGPNGGLNTLTATASGPGITGNPATFTATGTVLDPVAIALNDGDAQTAAVGTTVATAPAVLVTGAGGVPVPGVAVDFAVATGGGTAALTAAAAQVFTDANGVARVGSWTLGAVGENTLTATGPAGLTGNPVTFTATGILNAPEFAGNWVGNWNTTTFAVSGSVTMDIVVTPAAPSGANSQQTTGTLAATVDFNGNVLGQGDPAAETYDGSYGTDGFSFSAASPMWGALSVNVTEAGVLTGTGLNPAPGFTRVDFEGTITSTSWSVNYTVIFSSGFTAVGVWTMTK